MPAGGSTVEHAPVAVHLDGLALPVLADVGDQRLELVAADQGEDRRTGIARAAVSPMPMPCGCIDTTGCGAGRPAREDTLE